MNQYVGELTVKGIVTRDYSWFEPDNTNRKISENALLNLEDDFNDNITNDEYPFQNPIVVYWEPGMQKGRIQQGHHRFITCVRHNKAINYIITDCYRPCSRGQETKHQDYLTEDLVDSYAEEGIADYQLLRKLKEENPRYPYQSLTLFVNGVICSDDKTRRRCFVVEGSMEEAYTRATKRIKYFDEFSKAADRTDRPKEVIKVLIGAMERPDFDWDYFIGRCKANALEAKIRLDFKSVSTNAKATALVQFYYNHNSRKAFYF